MVEISWNLYNLKRFVRTSTTQLQRTWICHLNYVVPHCRYSRESKALSAQKHGFCSRKKGHFTYHKRPPFFLPSWPINLRKKTTKKNNKPLADVNEYRVTVFHFASSKHHTIYYSVDLRETNTPLCKARKKKTPCKM